MQVPSETAYDIVFQQSMSLARLKVLFDTAYDDITFHGVPIKRDAILLYLVGQS